MKKEINNCMDCDNYSCLLQAKSEKCKAFRVKRPEKIEIEAFEDSEEYLTMIKPGYLTAIEVSIYKQEYESRTLPDRIRNQACDDWEKYIRSIGGIAECKLLHEKGCQCENNER